MENAFNPPKAKRQKQHFLTLNNPFYRIFLSITLMSPYPPSPSQLFSKKPRRFLRQKCDILVRGAFFLVLFNCEKRSSA
tara:strand:- start:6648 stop:6884 length:237 start_codon:yes stop_codon:yes gene_type:complete